MTLTLQSIADRSAVVAVIGLGYVGLPLARAFAEKGFCTLALDIDPVKIEKLNAGRSYIERIPDGAVGALVKAKTLLPSADFASLAGADAIVICVPTPLTRQREPDMSYVVKTTESIAAHLRAGQLVVLESTTYPGTTDELVRPILEKTGLKSRKDFFLAFSPEREDPGNPNFSVANTAKVVGADGDEALALAAALYGAIVPKIVPVAGTATAEAVKLTENIFRAVNIALVNELKVVFDAMGIDVWDVIEAAKTKPFGFMPFYPGPGLGGHCIPIDPFYLSWKAREFDVATRFIELAGEINTAMPHLVVERLAKALDARFSRGIKGARLLLLGLAYKKNVDDTRESPALRLIELLEERGAAVDYHDPFVPKIPPTRHYGPIAGRASVALTPAVIAGYDAVVIVTDHDAVDYAAVARSAKLVIDTRNALRDAADRANIVKA
ncbi:MAG: nucleotide sugar dehydrogenase [Rhodospirillaceae bacterium]